GLDSPLLHAESSVIPSASARPVRAKRFMSELSPDAHRQKAFHVFEAPATRRHEGVGLAIGQRHAQVFADARLYGALAADREALTARALVLERRIDHEQPLQLGAGLEVDPLAELQAQLRAHERAAELVVRDVELMHARRK